MQESQIVTSKARLQSQGRLTESELLWLQWQSPFSNKLRKINNRSTWIMRKEGGGGRKRRSLLTDENEKKFCHCWIQRGSNNVFRTYFSFHITYVVSLSQYGQYISWESWSCKASWSLAYIITALGPRKEMTVGFPEGFWRKWSASGAGGCLSWMNHWVGDGAAIGKAGVWEPHPWWMQDGQFYWTTQ